MFEKIFRGVFLSDEQLRARRNSSAMWDALEALDKLKPGNWSVNKLQQHPDTRHDWSKGIKFYLTELPENNDDSLNTSEWYLIFGVRKCESKTTEKNNPRTESNLHESVVFSEVTYCCKSEIGSVVFSNFLGQIQESERNRRFAVGEGVRYLFARFNPSHGRHFSKDLYEDMHCALTSMTQGLWTTMSDEDLAEFINEKNNTLRPRYYGTPLSDESLEEMSSRGRP